MEKNKYSSQHLGHLAILAGIFKKIKLKERIDKLMPISHKKGAKVTMGERIIAMIYNALGFVENRRYMFSKFLKEKPIERLLGSHLSAEDFTDDALGRCLDEIYKYRSTKLVTSITLSIASELKLLGQIRDLYTY